MYRWCIRYSHSGTTINFYQADLGFADSVDFEGISSAISAEKGIVLKLKKQLWIVTY